MKNKSPQSHYSHHLEDIRHLIERQHLVENIVHIQEGPKHQLIQSLVQRQHIAELTPKLRELHIADMANLLETLPPNDRLMVWAEVYNVNGGDILLHVNDAVRPFLVNALSESQLDQLLNQLDADDLSFITQDIPQEALTKRLQALTQEDQHWVQSALTFKDDQVGTLMSNDMVVIRENYSISEALDHLRELTSLPLHTDKVFVTDHRGILVGFVEYLP